MWNLNWGRDNLRIRKRVSINKVMEIRPNKENRFDDLGMSEGRGKGDGGGYGFMDTEGRGGGSGDGYDLIKTNEQK